MRKTRYCTKPECVGRHYAKGLCHRHYSRSRYVPTGKPRGWNLEPDAFRKAKGLVPLDDDTGER